MGKSIATSARRLQEFARIVASDELRHPVPRPRYVTSPEQAKSRGLRMDEISENGDHRIRLPLSEVVSDCVNRWFQDAVKEAKAGDTSMQILVGQMYYNGYGVSRDAKKGRAWINRASQSRSSAWKVSDKRPGYNVSDSDSDDMKNEAK